MVDMQTEWKFGPAFFGLAVQTLLAAIAFVFIYGQQVSTAENTRHTTEKLEQLLERESNRTTDLGNRMIRVETVVEGIDKTVKTINDHLVAIPVRK